ncbi:MAG: metallophosphoesterase [Pseudomonadota bacterium]
MGCPDHRLIVIAFGYHRLKMTMAYIVIAGDVHGAIGFFYEQALKLQDELKEPIEAILQVGDLQIYSESSQVDKAVNRHGGPGEFPQWFKEQRSVPIPTYAILGNHDDAMLFYRYAGKEIIPSLHLLPQGEVVSINIGSQVVRVGSLGGNYSPKYFHFESDKLSQAKLKHYTEAHINSLVEKAPFDILLTHEAPDGVVIRDGADLGRPEIGALIRKTAPRYVFFGHHHWHVKAEIGSTTVVGLSRIQREGGMYPIRY